MAETPSTASSGFDGEALRQKICEEMKTHRGSPETLTRAVAKIILREGLGLEDKQMTDQYQCFRGLTDAKMGRANLAVTYEDVDLNTIRENPKILFELKSPDKEFNFTNKSYFEVVDQLKRYMRSRNCQTVEHGIIFNTRQLQVFRKHGNLIFYITKVIDFPDFNDRSRQVIEEIEIIISFLRSEMIEQPRRNQGLPGTIITVWNNKGGIGKTTTVSYLSLLLSMKNCSRTKIRRNRIVAIDFDHNQANLTKRFGCEKTDGKTEKLLDYIRIHGNLDQFEMKEYLEKVKCKNKKQNAVVDFLPADYKLSQPEYEARFAVIYDNKEDNPLRKLCVELSKKYDYIIIDTPPGWEQSIYARSAVAAADCLLPIGSYGDFDSFYGYYSVVCDKLPEIRQTRNDMGPDNLGLWINNWRPNDNSQIKEMNSKEIEFHIKNVKRVSKEELERNFFDVHGNLRRISYSAHIAKGACHNPEMKVNLLQTFNHAHILKAYHDLLTSIIGEV